MKATRKPNPRPFLLVGLMGVVWFMAVTQEVLAPPTGGGRTRTDSKPKDNSANQPPKPKTPDATSGLKGWITKYEAVPEGSEEEDLLGILTFRPLDKKARSTKLRVLKSDDPRVEVPGGSRLEVDRFNEILANGLLCTVAWHPVQGKGKAQDKLLNTVTLDTVEIEGKIEEISEEYVVIKGRPMEFKEWPDVEAAAGRTGRAPGPPPLNRGGVQPEKKAKPAKSKKLKLRTLDGITKYFDAEKKPVDATEFEVGQSVEAVVVYGKKEGIVIDLRSPSATDHTEDSGRDTPGGSPTGGKPPRPPGRGGSSRGQ